MNQRNIEKEIDKAIYERYFNSIPEDIKMIASAANYDLYFGPYPEGDNIDNEGVIYPGFSKAVDMIREYTDNLPNQLWYDAFSGELMENEPEGYTDEETGEYIEPCFEEIYCLDRKTILKAWLGKELISYL